MNRLTTWLCVCTTIWALDGSAAGDGGSQSVRAHFMLDGRVIDARDAIAVVSNQYFGGRETAVEKKDVLERRESRYWEETGAAKFQLFIDQSNRVWMVSLTVVVMGEAGRARMGRGDRVAGVRRQEENTVSGSC
jgi:hypothetical protein